MESPPSTHLQSRYFDPNTSPTVNWEVYFTLPLAEAEYQLAHLGQSRAGLMKALMYGGVALGFVAVLMRVFQGGSRRRGCRQMIGQLLLRRYVRHSVISTFQSALRSNYLWLLASKRVVLMSSVCCGCRFSSLDWLLRFL